MPYVEPPVCQDAEADRKALDAIKAGHSGPVQLGYFLLGRKVTRNAALTLGRRTIQSLKARDLIVESMKRRAGKIEYASHHLLTLQGEERLVSTPSG